MSSFSKCMVLDQDHHLQRRKELHSSFDTPEEPTLDVLPS